MAGLIRKLLALQVQRSPREGLGFCQRKEDPRAALKVTPPEQSKASAVKPLTLSNQGAASCCHEDTALYHNQRPPRD